MNSSVTSLALVLLFAACSDSDPSDLRSGMTGIWSLYERGYSPGAGYIVEHVPPAHSQMIAFRLDGSFDSNIKGLDEFSYYTLLEDATGNPVLALYTIPAQRPSSVAEAMHSYYVTLNDGWLRLDYRFCDEGCHLGFTRSANRK